MHFAAQTKEAAEAHDERTPAHRINVGSRAVAHQQLFLDVEFCDVYFEHVGAHVFAEGTEVVNDPLHLHWTLAHTRRPNRFRLHRGEPGNAEFVLFMAVTPLAFLLGHWIFAGSERETVNLAHEIVRRQIDYTLTGADEVVGSLAHLAQTQHAAPTQPPG